LVGLNQQINLVGLTQEGQFMQKCYNQHCASKKAKETLMQCDVGCNSIHKIINNGSIMVLIEVLDNG